MKSIYLVIIALLLVGCSERPVSQDAPKITKSDGIVSPEGWCVASVYEIEDVKERNTQVLLDFDQGKCGSGAVSFNGTQHHLKLHWIEKDKLEIRYPSGLKPQRNASGEVLQCGERKVLVKLTPSAEKNMD